MCFLNIRSRWKWWLLVGMMTVWLLWMTLRPDGNFLRSELHLTPLSEHSEAVACVLNSRCLFQRTAWRFLLVDVIGNIVVFMPLGFGLAGALAQANFKRTLWSALLGGFMISLAIELLQLAVPTRTTDVDDLIFNSLGALLGVIVFTLVMRKTSPNTTNR